MNVALRKVGNSQAVIIPKAILLQLKLQDSLNLEVIENKIVLSKPKTKRENWAAVAQQIAEANDDELVLDFVSDNEEDWQW